MCIVLPIITVIERVKTLRRPQSFTHLLATEDKPHNRGERDPAPDDSKDEERELISDLVTQRDGIEGEGEAKFLADKVDQLC